LPFEIKFNTGSINRKIVIPNAPGHPNLTIKRVVDPITTIGKSKAFKNDCSLCSITVKSFDNRFVILPISDSFMTYSVNFVILAYNNMARAAFILELRTQQSVQAFCLII